MDKAKAKITQEIDGWWSVAIYDPHANGGARTLSYPRDWTKEQVCARAQGIIDALHEALDEVECDA